MSDLRLTVKKPLIPNNQNAFLAYVYKQEWDSDQIIELSVQLFDATEVFVTCTEDELKEVAQAAANDDLTLDWIFHKAVQLGIIEEHLGPFDVSLEPLGDTYDYEFDAIFKALKYAKDQYNPPIPVQQDVDECGWAVITTYGINHQTAIQIYTVETDMINDLVERLQDIGLPAHTDEKAETLAQRLTDEVLYITDGYVEIIPLIREDEGRWSGTNI